ncbi:MAG: serpin family protein [Rickettsiales bacterium]
MESAPLTIADVARNLCGCHPDPDVRFLDPIAALQLFWLIKPWGKSKAGAPALPECPLDPEELQKYGAQVIYRHKLISLPEGYQEHAKKLGATVMTFKEALSKNLISLNDQSARMSHLIIRNNTSASGRWEHPFPSEKTQQDTFHGVKSSTVLMMHSSQGESVQYLPLIRDECDIVVLRYNDEEGKFAGSAVFGLPPANDRFIPEMALGAISELTAQDISYEDQCDALRTMHVSLPKCDLTSQGKLESWISQYLTFNFQIKCSTSFALNLHELGFSVTGETKFEGVKGMITSFIANSPFALVIFDNNHVIQGSGCIYSIITEAS